MKSIEIECSSCGGTGVYCGMFEPNVCVDCSGTGKEIIYYKPFTKKKEKKGVKEVYVSGEKFASAKKRIVPYKEFRKAKTIKDIENLFKL